MKASSLSSMVACARKPPTLSWDADDEWCPEQDHTNPRAERDSHSSHDSPLSDASSASSDILESIADTSHKSNDNQLALKLKENDLEGIAYGAELLLRMKNYTCPTQPNYGITGGRVQMGPTTERAKRATPDSDTDSSNFSLGNFLISGPQPAKLFPTSQHQFKKGKYATTGGDRGFMTVFEYEVRGNTMMIDVDTSFIRFTSITQAIGRNKVNFGRLIRSCPELEPHIHKLKGGYLSIQGTWLPYDLAKELSRRIAWEIRDHLVPLFGYDFPDICLRPEDEGFGQLAIGPSQKRARKRHNNGGPHQTSCYGPATPIRVIDGQLIEQASTSQSYDPFNTATTATSLIHNMTWPTSAAGPSTAYPSYAHNAYNTYVPPMVPIFAFDSQSHAL